MRCVCGLAAQEFGLRVWRAGQMEQEMNPTPEKAAAPEPVEGICFAERINRQFKGLGAESLPIPARQTTRTPPVFEKPSAD